MSTSRPHYSRQKNISLILPLIVLALGLVLLLGYFLLFREPDQKQDPPQQEQTGQQEQTPSSGSTETPTGSTGSEADAQKSHFERKENFYTILLSGVDDSNGGSDTNILLAVDAKNDRIYGVSIPRDTKAIIYDRAQKINAAYLIGGMDLLADVVSEQLGIPVDYTVRVDLKGFEALVNAIGGVDFDIPINMNYDDPLQGLSIHFSKGFRHLNGEEALKVVRFRHNNDGTGYGNEDIGRMQTQQKFLKAVAKKTLTVSNLSRVNDFVSIFQTYVKTDLTLGNLAWLGKEAISIGSDNLEFSTLPSNWISPYIYLDAEATLTLINEHLNPYVEDRTMEDLNIPS